MAVSGQRTDGFHLKTAVFKQGYDALRRLIEEMIADFEQRALVSA
jgi:hypothetical protein